MIEIRKYAMGFATLGVVLIALAIVSLFLPITDIGAYYGGQYNQFQSIANGSASGLAQAGGLCLIASSIVILAEKK